MSRLAQAHPLPGSGVTSHTSQLLTRSGLFVEPKWAQFLQSSGVVEALGRPMPNPLASPGLLDGQGERII